jgi:hypothetical protein
MLDFATGHAALDSLRFIITCGMYGILRCECVNADMGYSMPKHVAKQSSQADLDTLAKARKNGEGFASRVQNEL